MRLFAERGVDNVSLAEITRAAGQRNASAINYHFGNREAVLVAILQPFVTRIRERRVELLRRAEESPGDARAAAEAIVRPVLECAGQGWRGRAYLEIGLQLNHAPGRLSPAVRDLFDDTRGYEALALIADRCPALPADIHAERITLVVDFLARAAADRGSRHTGAGGTATLDDERFLQNLIDMYLGALTAPVSEGALGRGATVPKGVGRVRSAVVPRSVPRPTAR